jgi:hypothetical protein
MKLRAIQPPPQYGTVKGNLIKGIQPNIVIEK